ncbi:energy-coupling factor transporter transmembrane protein EcfT [bacterium]|jgi:energy-coupling factor transport system permease protein|nr:energy-coupling factor transporter transmembrane protein EcfT [bacterium]
MNIALGRYIPYDSIIHRLDPRTKLLALIALLVAIFFKLSFWEYAFLIVVCLALILISKVKFRSILQAFKPMWLMMLFLLIINVLVIKRGDALFTIASFTCYSGAIFQTLQIIIRLALMISLTTILTSTTKPLDLTYAIEWFLSPLRVLRFPTHEIAMTISLALRFIPTLFEETQKLIKAQASRGVDLQSGKLKEKIGGLVSLIVPLFVSAFQKSEELADAMEARGYNPGAKRTRYRKLDFAIRDLVGLLVCALIVFLSIYSSYHPEIVRTLEIWKN